MNEKEKKTNQNRQREKEIGIFFMMGFDSATSSFLALLVNKSYRKKQKKAILKKFSTSHKKSSKTFVVSKVLSSNQSAGLRKFHWPKMVVKIRKGQKILKNFGNNCKF